MDRPDAVAATIHAVPHEVYRSTTDHGFSQNTLASSGFAIIIGRLALLRRSRNVSTAQ
jgi:hypothetical protein